MEKAHHIRDALGNKSDMPVADKMVQGLNDRMMKMTVYGRAKPGEITFKEAADTILHLDFD